MENISFQVAQKRVFLGLTLVGVASLVLAVVVAFLDAPGPAITLGVFGAVAAPVCFDSMIARTELTTTGLRTRSLFFRHSCTWDEIAGIEIKVTNSRDSMSAQIVIRLKTDKPFKLRAPVDSTVSSDPDFDRALAQIRAYWNAHAASS